MELNSGNVKKILGIVTFSILLFVGAQHLVEVWAGFVKIMSFFTPFVLGLAMAFALNVLMQGIERLVQKGLKKNKNNTNKKQSKLIRLISLLTSLSVVSSLLLIFYFVVVPEFKATIELVVNNLPGFADRFQDWVTKTLSSLPVDSKDIPQVELDWAAIQEKVSSLVSQGGFALFNTTVGITVNILVALFNLLLGMVFAIYVLLQKEDLGRQIKKLMDAYLSPERVKFLLKIIGLSSDIFSRFVSGQFLEALIIGVLCYIGMLVFKMPYALVVSILVGVSALIPVFGAFIGTAAGAFLILIVEPMKAVWFILFIVVLQQLEGNLIYPKVVGNSIGLPGIWVLVAVTIGGSAFGIAGMLIGVPLTSVVYSLLREATHNKLTQAKKAEKRGQKRPQIIPCEDRNQK